MTFFFVIPANREAAFRAYYNNLMVPAYHKTNRKTGKSARDEGEQLGPMQPNADGTMLTASSRRYQEPHARDANTGRPWLEIYTSWPPPGGWEYPD